MYWWEKKKKNKRRYMDLCGFGLGGFLPHSQSHHLKPRSRSEFWSISTSLVCFLQISVWVDDWFQLRLQISLQRKRGARIWSLIQALLSKIDIVKWILSEQEKWRQFELNCFCLPRCLTIFKGQILPSSCFGRQCEHSLLGRFCA